MSTKTRVTNATSAYTEQRAGKGPSASLPLGRLAAVELRKLVDTRGGVLLLELTMLGGLAVMAIRAFAFDPDLQGTVAIAGTVFGLLLPVLGIIAVTSEWSKRTALVTFALEPRRWRVLVAKGIAGILLALAISTLTIAAAHALVAIASAVNQEPARFAVDTTVLIGWVATNVIGVLCGIAVGTLFLNAAAAIVAFFIGGVAWNLLSFTGDLGATLAKWLDLNGAAGPLANGEMTAQTWGPLAVSLAAWVVVPFVVGVIRVTRTELR